MDWEELFCQIGELHGVSGEEVRREIEIAITAAFTNPDQSAEVKAYLSKIPCKGDIPTPEEFMTFVILKTIELEINKNNFPYLDD